MCVLRLFISNIYYKNVIYIHIFSSLLDRNKMSIPLRNVI